jgi:Fe-S-cluster containining protein
MATHKGRTSNTSKKAASPLDQAGLAGLDLEARRSQRLHTAASLRQSRTPLKVMELATDAVSRAEDAVRRAEQADPPPPRACQEGCDWCCYLRVGTAAPEVLRIAAYLRQTLSEEELQATRERVRHLDEQRRQRPAGRREDPLPCALLVNRRCAAYPVRPLTCRGFNSADAHLCELSLNPHNKVVVPAYGPQIRLNTFVLDGLRAGTEEARLQGDLLELTAALRIALEVPDAAERWLAGAPVFASARLG